MNLDKIQINYILGLGRSGTTLLLRELGKSKRVISNPESLFILDFLYVNDPKKKMKSGEITFFIDQIFSLKTGRFVSLDLWRIDKEKLLKSIQALPFVTFLDLIKLVNLHSEFGQKVIEVAFILDKNPPYTLHFEQLKKLDENSKFIGIYRSYLDNIISRNKYKLDAFNHPYFHALMWCQFNDALLSYRKHDPNKIHLIQYENLVENPDFHLIKARAFLGISSELREENVSTLNGLLENLKSDREKEQFLEMHGKVFKSIDTSAVGNKTIPFSSHQINAIHAICSKTSIKLGYEPINFSTPSYFVLFQIKWFQLLLFFTESKHKFYYYSSHRTRKWMKLIVKPWSVFT